MTAFRLVQFLLAWVISPSCDLRAGDIETEIRRMEFVPYLEKFIESSPTIKASVTPDIKVQLFGMIEQFRNKKLSGLSVQVVEASEFYRFVFILAEFDEHAVVVQLLYGRYQTEFLPFHLGINMFPDDAATMIKRVYSLLPDAPVDKGFNDEIARRLNSVFEAKDFTKFDQFERSLVEKAGAVPGYIRYRVQSKTEEETAKDNTLFRAFEIPPRIKFAGSKTIAERLFAALFITETPTAPAAFVVIYIMHEGKPLIADLSGYFGQDAIRYYPEFVKAFPVAEGKK